jgi:hypothetical protein
MFGFRTPPRAFAHPDGREWKAHVDGAKLMLSIRDADGDTFERAVAHEDSTAATRELQRLVIEQLEEGFVETSPPVWRVFVDELVNHYKSEAPSFDVDALRARAEDEGLVEALMALGDRWITRRNGETTLEFDMRSIEELAAPFERNPDASLPVLLLGLRHHDNGAQMRVDAILGRLRRPESLDAMLSIVEHPAPNSIDRAPQHFPTHAIVSLGVPSREVGERLSRGLDHGDFRVAAACAAVLAEFAMEDRLFLPLLAHVERGKREEGFAWTLMRAAEVRRDRALRPFLEWMQKSKRFRSAGYPERIRAALAALPHTRA